MQSGLLPLTLTCEALRLCQEADAICQRDLNLECAAFIDRTRDRDRAAMQFDEFLHQRKPDARTFVRAAAAVFDAVKAFEDIGQLFRWNADAGVFNGEFRLTVDLHQSNRYAALQRELECVADQIRIIFSHMSRST
jgi:hypothetical protein